MVVVNNAVVDKVLGQVHEAQATVQKVSGREGERGGTRETRGNTAQDTKARKTEAGWHNESKQKGNRASSKGETKHEGVRRVNK